MLKKRKTKQPSLEFIKEALTLIGGLAGSILAIYGLVKTFKENAEGFSWLIPLGIVIWLIILWRLFQYRKSAALSLFIISLLIGAVAWIGWQAQVGATQKKLVVLVAKFDGPEEEFHLRDEVLKQLKTITKDYEDTEIVPLDEVITEAQGSEYARRIGSDRHADLVIWGWYTQTQRSNLNLYFENLAPDQIETLPQHTNYQPSASLADLESLSIQQQIGANLSGMVAFMAGYIHYNLMDFKTALDRFEQVRTIKTDNVFIKPEYILFLIGNCNLYLDHNEQAISSYTQEIQIAPDNTRAYVNRGVAYSRQGLYIRAINDYNNAIQMQPDDNFAYNNRGAAYDIPGKYDAALRDCQQAIHINPRDPVAYFNRGIVYGHLGKQEQAIHDYSQAIQLRPDYAEALTNRGAIYGALGQYKPSIADLDASIRLNPSIEENYLDRGLTYASLANYDQALSDFDKALEIAPNDPEAYFDRGNAFYQKGQCDKAVTNFSQAITLKPTYFEAYSNRGGAYICLQEYGLALDDFSTAIKINPAYAPAYNNRGAAYQRLGKATEAEADFKKYQQLTGKKP